MAVVLPCAVPPTLSSESVTNCGTGYQCGYATLIVVSLDGGDDEVDDDADNEDFHSANSFLIFLLERTVRVDQYGCVPEGFDFLELLDLRADLGEETDELIPAVDVGTQQDEDSV